MLFSFLAGSPFIAFMLFLGIAWGFMWGIEKNKDSGLGVALLLGFTFFMGLMLSRILQVALGFSNGGSMIAMAAGGTGAIFFTLRRSPRSPSVTSAAWASSCSSA
jgi:modulator of FtsH protease